MGVGGQGQGLVGRERRMVAVSPGRGRAPKAHRLRRRFCLCDGVTGSVSCVLCVSCLCGSARVLAVLQGSALRPSAGRPPNTHFPIPAMTPLSPTLNGHWGY